MHARTLLPAPFRFPNGACQAGCGDHHQLPQVPCRLCGHARAVQLHRARDGVRRQLVSVAVNRAFQAIVVLSSVKPTMNCGTNSKQSYADEASCGWMWLTRPTGHADHTCLAFSTGTSRAPATLPWAVWWAVCRWSRQCRWHPVTCCTSRATSGLAMQV